VSLAEFETLPNVECDVDITFATVYLKSYNYLFTLSRYMGM
jgi:hypothetical protein